MPRRAATRTEIERLIADLAESLGWLHHHARCPGRTRDGYIDGFPGEVLLRDDRLLLLTVAGARGELSPPEIGWATALAGVAAVESHVVGPRDLRALSDLLRRPAPRGCPPEPRAPPRQTDARPTAGGGGRRKQPQHPTAQEETCEGPRSS